MNFFNKIKELINNLKKKSRYSEILGNVLFFMKIQAILDCYVPKRIVILGIGTISITDEKDKFEITFYHFDDHQELVMKEVTFPLEFLDMTLSEIRKEIESQS